MTELYHVDTSTRDTFLSSGQNPRLPGFEARTLEDAHTFKELRGSVFSFNVFDAPVGASLITKPSDDHSRLLVNFEPFSDGTPQSNPDDLTEFLATMALQDTGSFSAKVKKEFKGKPHSWGPLVRSAVIHDELVASGHGRPVLTIYNPIPGGAVFDGKRRVKNGDFSPFVRVASHGIHAAIDRLHGRGGAFEELFFAGQSLGAVRAIQVANGFQKMHEAVCGVVAQEAVVYQEPNTKDGLYKIMQDYMFRKYDEPDATAQHTADRASYDFERIPEHPLRKKQDAYGAEPLGMIKRMVRGMVPRDMIGLTKSGVRTTEHVLELAANGVHVTLANAVDSAVSRYMRNWVTGQDRTPNQFLHSILVSPLRGQQLGHMVNEYGTTTGLVIAGAVAKSAK